MWMNVEILCFIVIFYVASLASLQTLKKNPGPYLKLKKLRPAAYKRSLKSVLQDPTTTPQQLLEYWVEPLTP
jgi:hypothetical protein